MKKLKFFLLGVFVFLGLTAAYMNHIQKCDFECVKEAIRLYKIKEQ